MDLLDPKFLFAGVILTALMFVLVAYFSRAGGRRITGVLIASLPIIPMVMFYDKVASQMAGGTTQPSLRPAHHSPGMYLRLCGTGRPSA